MNWVDFFIGVVLILAIAIGYKRGIFKELTTFLGLVIASIAALNYADWVAVQLESLVNMAPSLRFVLSFVVCFAVVLFIFKLLGHYFYKMVKLSPLGFSDKIGGAAFGALKGIAILSLIFLMFIFLPVFQSFNDSIDDSVMAPYIRQFIPTAFDMTGHFHPKSGEFTGKVTSGLLGSQAEKYAGNPESLLDKDNPLGFSLEDLRVLNNIDKYFGEQVEVAAKGEQK